MKKIAWAIWTCDVRERVKLATIMQNDVFDYNVWTKALRMKILVSRSVFGVKECDGAIYFALWPWPFKVMTYAKSHFGPYLSC